MTNAILALISMALSKTFDTIPQGLLLGKLKAYGVNSRSAWYENNRIIANPSKHQGMLLGNTEHHFHFSRLSKDLGLGFGKESARMALNFEWRLQI